jgi:hypothetical protein
MWCGVCGRPALPEEIDELRHKIELPSPDEIFEGQQLNSIDNARSEATD